LGRVDSGASEGGEHLLVLSDNRGDLDDHSCEQLDVLLDADDLGRGASCHGLLDNDRRLQDDLLALPDQAAGQVELVNGLHLLDVGCTRDNLAVLLPLLSFVPVRLLRRAHNSLLGGFQFRRRVLDLQQLLDVLLHLSLRRVALDHVLQRLVLRLAAVDERRLAISRVCLDAVLQVLCNVPAAFDGPELVFFQALPAVAAATAAVRRQILASF